ncbi:trypsin-like peptidase domain-containing protein [Paenibacillus sp. P96]|uniref:Trypsin-like peptidase domain-containing protein n=1 Tax=Paenibacillus zeirhizosphaerae TaxID=2987519 RepID=A0ABT9FLB5_9BACL|nr:trypsin-like peptidase domain-containing protein [Paenibacillus sp. P96]MDP4095524.1 trypsin-like peptidase domain-containing protein [Paenibacillus sp. P96]
MDEFNKNNTGRREGDEAERNTETARQPESNDSSYYYSYGPFSSINAEDKRAQNGMHHRTEVEVTEPAPVKPVPTLHSNASRDYQNSNRNRQEGNWQFKQKKPKSTLKTAFLSFLAGMLVITVLMYTADRMNLFTGNAAESATAAVQNDSPSASSSNSGSNAIPAVMPAGTADVQSVVKTASPAVVKIETLARQTSGSRRNSQFDDPLYQYFFGDSFGGSSQNNSGSQSGQLQPLGIGSGFVFDKSGYILTNNHVIEGADVVQVTVEGNNKPYEAKVLGKSADLDLAVLKIEGDNNFPTVSLGDSDQAQVGEWMVAIGNPEGFEHTVTAGVLSAKDRTITINDESTGQPSEYKNLIQTDASINPGNSGGPLLNLQGQVIGMNVAVSADAQGIGFAIPSKTIKGVLEQLKNNQEIPQEPVPFIGASLIDLTSEVANQMGTSLAEGSVVGEIVYKSPAYDADLRPYDIIIGANGKNYATAQDLIEFIQSQKVGDTITLNIERNGQKMDLTVKIGNKNDFTTQTDQNSNQ